MISPRLSWPQIIGAIIIGCVVELLLIAVIATHPPDPPMNVYNAIILLSQSPAILLGTILPESDRGFTNTESNILLFFFNTPFCIIAILFIMWVYNRKTAVSNSGSG